MHFGIRNNRKVKKAENFIEVINVTKVNIIFD